MSPSLQQPYVSVVVVVVSLSVRQGPALNILNAVSDYTWRC